MSVWFDKSPLDLEALTRMGAASMPGHIGIEFIAVGDDWITARMPVDARTRQPFGRLHGGASVALAETVGSVAGMLTVDPAVQLVVGMEINANHIRAARDGWVRATARPESIGRTTQVWSIRIVDDAERLVCISRITLAVIARERG